MLLRSFMDYVIIPTYQHMCDIIIYFIAFFLIQIEMVEKV